MQIWFEDCIFQHFIFAKNAIMKNEWCATANHCRRSKNQGFCIPFSLSLSHKTLVIEASLVIWKREIRNPQSFSLGFAFLAFFDDDKSIIADVFRCDDPNFFDLDFCIGWRRYFYWMLAYWSIFHYLWLLIVMFFQLRLWITCYLLLAIIRIFYRFVCALFSLY